MENGRSRENSVYSDSDVECPALVTACKDGQHQLVDELIQAGADLNSTDEVYTCCLLAS